MLELDARSPKAEVFVPMATTLVGPKEDVPKPVKSLLAVNAKASLTLLPVAVPIFIRPNLPEAAFVSITRKETNGEVPKAPLPKTVLLVTVPKEPPLFSSSKYEALIVSFVRGPVKMKLLIEVAVPEISEPAVPVVVEVPKPVI